jgi:hypothetical protein
LNIIAVLKLKIKITANHNGYFEFMICNVDGMSTDATQNCLNQNYLKDSAGQTKIVIEKGYNGKIYTSLQLPASLSCNHCVFQVCKRKKIFS